MILTTLKKVWQGAGVAGAVLLSYAWMDSCSYRAEWHSGSSAAGGWEFHLLSRSSALHFVAEESSPFPAVLLPLFPGMSASTPPWTLHEPHSQGGEGLHFPPPYLAKGTSTVSSTGPCSCVATLGSKPLPVPTVIGDYTAYLILPYWLLLLVEAALWISGLILVRKALRKASAPEAGFRS